MGDRLLKTLHETAQDLHEIGPMDVVTMREFDVLCLPPIKKYSAAQIRRLRQRAKASQAVFAACLNTSVSTVQKWGAGAKASGPFPETARPGRSQGLGSPAVKPCNPFLLSRRADRIGPSAHLRHRSLTCFAHASVGRKPHLGDGGPQTRAR